MTDSRKPDAGCPCMAYQDQLPLYARSARVPDERFIPWRFCPWCGRDSRSPIPAQPSPEQRFGEDEVQWEIWRDGMDEGPAWQLLDDDGSVAQYRLGRMRQQNPGADYVLVRAVTTRSVVSPPADTPK